MLADREDLPFILPSRFRSAFESDPGLRPTAWLAGGTGNPAATVPARYRRCPGTAADAAVGQQ